MIECKECQKVFEETAGLHRHLRQHKLKTHSYYEKHYPKLCLQTGQKLKWKDGDKLEIYLNRHFVNKEALFEYFLVPSEEKKQLLFSYFEAAYKKHGKAPCQTELASLPMSPNLLTLGKFLPYKELCDKNGWISRFDYSFDYTKPLPIQKIPAEEFMILVDSREQAPYRCFNIARGKLDFGDYALASQLYNKVNIERKGISDFWGTMASAISEKESLTRFQRELERVREKGAYLIILCEYNIHEVEKYHGYGYATPQFVMHNMRNIFRQYEDCCQFVFGVNRQASVRFLVEFLLCGQQVRKYDLQYYVDLRYRPYVSEEFTKEDLQKLYL